MQKLGMSVITIDVFVVVASCRGPDLYCSCHVLCRGREQYDRGVRSALSFLFVHPPMGQYSTLVQATAGSVQVSLDSSAQC